MTDYAKQDVDMLRTIAEYCGGNEYRIFLNELADRMEAVVSDVVRPVFTREDVEELRGRGDEADIGQEPAGEPGWGRLHSIADRIEQTLPAEAKA